mgnify:CR=1 FL=1
MKPAVSVNDVTKRYGEVEALKSATFSVNPRNVSSRHLQIQLVS